MCLERRCATTTSPRPIPATAAGHSRQPAARSKHPKRSHSRCPLRPRTRSPVDSRRAESCRIATSRRDCSLESDHSQTTPLVRSVRCSPRRTAVPCECRHPTATTAARDTTSRAEPRTETPPAHQVAAGPYREPSASTRSPSRIAVRPPSPARQRPKLAPDCPTWPRLRIARFGPVATSGSAP